MYWLNYAIGLLVFEIDVVADQYVLTNLQDHHRYPCCILLLLGVHNFIYFNFIFRYIFCVN